MRRAALLPMVAFACFAYGEVVTYEGDVLPEEFPWERVGSGRAVRSVDDGLFVQFLEISGILDAYQRSLEGFAGQQTFFIEWRVETDAPASILDSSGVPAVLSAGGGGSIAVYHTTITDARVQLFRDTSIPLVFVDITPGLLHTYRLELHGQNPYVWFIDGQVVDSGVPQGSYPNADSILIWGAREFGFPTTTRWDYIRYGTIPLDASGDFDSDAAVGLDDFYFFHECLSDARPELPGGPGGNSGPGCRFADFDFDTDTDLRDFAAFENAFGQPQ